MKRCVIFIVGQEDQALNEHSLDEFENDVVEECKAKSKKTSSKIIFLS